MIPREKLDQILQRASSILEARLNAGAAVAELPALSREYAELKPVVEEIRRYRDLLRERGGGRAAARRSRDDASSPRRSSTRIRAALPEAERAVQLALLPRDAADERSAILEIRAGTGGEEAALFAADLARMYQRLAEARGWRWEVVEASPTELGGFRELVAEISGRGVFAALKFEIRRASGAAGAGDRGERADPHLGGDGGGAAGGRGGRHRDPGAGHPHRHHARVGRRRAAREHHRLGGAGSPTCRPGSW